MTPDLGPLPEPALYTTSDVEAATVLAEEVFSLRAALRKDAERYRWLRTQIERQRLVIAESCGWDGLKSWSGDNPDKYIDAAMAAAPAVGAT